MYDLLLKGGWVLDPGQNLNQIADVAFQDGRVANVEADIPASNALDSRDVSGKIVAPGLIDFHTHVYWGGTSLGVEAETVARCSGTTTFVDVGSAGAGNFLGFRRHVIEPSPVRILSFLNISYAGIFGFSRSVMVGEAADLRLLDVAEATRIAQQNPDLIVGIKVRVGRIAGEANGVAPLDLALEAAEAAGVPVMAHIDLPPPTRAQVLERLRPGDICTHAFRPFPNSALDGRGRLRAEMLEARQRGVIFDIGHGMGSLSFAVARAMLEQGFLPDCISSDVHALCIDGPAYNLLVTMSKFLCLGMYPEDIIRAATWAPARAMRQPDLGTLHIGAIGDATVLDVQEGQFQYVDSVGEVLEGRQRFHLAGIVIGGQWWSDGEEV